MRLGGGDGGRRDTPLPLHMRANNNGTTTGGGGAGGSPLYHKTLHSVMEKGLSSILAPTKAGSGEKEKAYIVRQNTMLKVLLFFVVAIAVASIVAFNTVLELNIVRRGMIRMETIHHKKEHHEHEAIMRANLELQQALESIVEETQAIEEFRAFFQKSVGTSDEEVEAIFKASGIQDGGEALKKVKTTHRNFIRRAEAHLGKVINRFHSTAKNAHAKLVALAKLISSEAQLDARETEKFFQRLEEWGVNEQYAEGLLHDDPYLNEDDPLATPPPELGQDDDEHNEPPKPRGEAGEEGKAFFDDRADERAVEKELEQFFKHLATIPVYTEIKPATIREWEKMLDGYIQTMDDASKEVDLELVAKRMEETIAKAFVEVKLPPDTPPPYKYDPSEHDSPLDFYEAFIERIKIGPFKQQLQDVYDGWKSGKDPKLTAFTVLANIETLANDNQLWALLQWFEDKEPDPEVAFEDGEEEKQEKRR